jgi:hypothetical protein
MLHKSQILTWVKFLRITGLAFAILESRVGDFDNTPSETPRAYRWSFWQAQLSAII